MADGRVLVMEEKPGDCNECPIECLKSGLLKDDCPLQPIAEFMAKYCEENNCRIIGNDVLKIMRATVKQKSKEGGRDA